MNALKISSIKITQLEGLYSLNDLHKAAGGEEKHKPANFARLDTTHALIEELSIVDAGCVPIQTFRGGVGIKHGTYVCRELVYAYAMWISAKFSLQVIRAYDDLVRKATPKPTLPEGTQSQKRLWALFFGLVKENQRAGMDDASAWLIAGRAVEEETGFDLLAERDNPHTGPEGALLVALPEDLEYNADKKVKEGKWLTTAQRIALRVALDEVVKAAPDKYRFGSMVGDWLAQFMGVTCEEQIRQHRFNEALSILRLKAEMERAS